MRRTSYNVKGQLISADDLIHHPDKRLAALTFLKEGGMVLKLKKNGVLVEATKEEASFLFDKIQHLLLSLYDPDSDSVIFPEPSNF